jgi:biotin synthase-like enzyme
VSVHASLNNILLHEVVFKIYKVNAHKLSFFSSYLQQTSQSQIWDNKDEHEDLFESADANLFLMFSTVKSISEKFCQPLLNLQRILSLHLSTVCGLLHEDHPFCYLSKTASILMQGMSALMENPSEKRY